MKKHDSLDNPPPNYPYFKVRKTHMSDANKENTTKVTDTALSPTSRIQTRTLCIEQLQKIGDLLSKKLISEDQHKELHDAIMKDML